MIVSSQSVFTGKDFLLFLKGLEKTYQFEKFNQTQEVFKPYALSSAYSRSCWQSRNSSAQGARSPGLGSPFTHLLCGLGQVTSLLWSSFDSLYNRWLVEENSQVPSWSQIENSEIGRSFSLTRTHRSTRNSTSREPQPAPMFSS